MAPKSASGAPGSCPESDSRSSDVEEHRCHRHRVTRRRRILGPELAKLLGRAGRGRVFGPAVTTGAGGTDGSSESELCQAPTVCRPPPTSDLGTSSPLPPRSSKECPQAYSCPNRKPTLAEWSSQHVRRIRCDPLRRRAAPLTLATHMSGPRRASPPPPCTSQLSQARCTFTAAPRRAPIAAATAEARRRRRQTQHVTRQIRNGCVNLGTRSAEYRRVKSRRTGSES